MGQEEQSQRGKRGDVAMKGTVIRSLYLVCIALLLLLAIEPAKSDPGPEPWPSYQAQTYIADYVGGTAALSDGLWYYYITIDADAVDPTYGDVIGIKGLAVYLAAGDPVPTWQIPTDWTGYDTPFTKPDWFYGDGYEPSKGAFGYITGSPTGYVPPDGQPYLIGAAQFPDTFTPGDQLFLVHLACDMNGSVNTFWARPGKGSAVPEPSSMMALGAGLFGLGGLLLRRKH